MAIVHNHYVLDPNLPLAARIPHGGMGRPNPEFAHHLFDRLIFHLGQEVGSSVDFVVADQLGDRFGRLHQHAILAAQGLAEYCRKEIWEWLRERAGWSRVLPFEHGAAFVLAQREMEKGRSPLV